MSIQAIIERYLLENHLSDGSRDRIDNNELLFALGILDSLAFVQLIAFIQEEFNVTIQDRDVVVENFQNLDAIEALILRIKQE
jgi:methoxymalonate biosynthesis acyl carrier protein